MKLICPLIIFILTSLQVSSQNKNYVLGEIGVGLDVRKEGKTWMTGPGFNLNAQMLLLTNFSIGPEFHAWYVFDETANNQESGTQVGGRMEFHFYKINTSPEKFNSFLFACFGNQSGSSQHRIWQRGWLYDFSRKSFQAGVGFRGFIDPNLGFFLQLGIGTVSGLIGGLVLML